MTRIAFVFIFAQKSRQQIIKAFCISYLHFKYCNVIW